MSFSSVRTLGIRNKLVRAAADSVLVFHDYGQNTIAAACADGTPWLFAATLHVGTTDIEFFCCVDGVFERLQ